MIDRLLAFIRNFFFWQLDRVKGSPIKSSYDEIAKIDQTSSNDIAVINYQSAKLESILNQAVDTTDYYSQIENPRINEFPVIDKEIINQNYDKFQSSEFRDQKTHTMSTSGSTGTPFTIHQDDFKKRRVHAEIIYYSEKVGYEVGNRLIFMRATDERKTYNFIKKLGQNNIVINISNLSKKNIQRIIEKIKRLSNSKTVLLAYPSTYEQIALTMKEQKNKFKKNQISGMISSGELLEDTVRSEISEVFNTKIVSRYSNQENGVIGQDTPGHGNKFIINEANYIVEVFDMNEDIPVSQGTVGRIVITDLFNRAMPIIRYDTGDIGAIESINYNGLIKKTITNFGGRKNDMVLNTSGNKISAHRISILLNQFDEVNQFQFVQKNKKEYTVRIVSSKARLDSDMITNELYSTLGEDAQIEVEQREEIPILESGKRKYVINNYEESS